jgi:D-alanyl-D-alanine endopeptidase (penicillin-binding protein 7)
MSNASPSCTYRIALACAAVVLVGLAAGPAEARHRVTKVHTAARAVVPNRQAMGPEGTPELKLASNAVLVREEGSLDPLLSRQADVASPIASITKLMTALVVLDGGQPLDEVIQLSPEDGDLEKSSSSRLRTGTLLTRSDLLHLALMSSENRAAHALGRNYPGGVPAFVQAMNAKAAQLGMRSARFVEPTGLSSDNVASPSDLVLLVDAAAREPLIREYSTDGQHEVRVGRQKLQFHNTDALVHNPAWDIVVQKTGYISEAGRCLVLKAVIKGRSVVMVLLDSFGKNTRVADAARIRKWLEAKLAEVPHRGSPPAA